MEYCQIDEACFANANMGTDAMFVAEKQANEFMGEAPLETESNFMGSTKKGETKVDIDAICNGIENLKIAATVRSIPENHFNSRTHMIKNSTSSYKKKAIDILKGFVGIFLMENMQEAIVDCSRPT